MQYDRDELVLTKRPSFEEGVAARPSCLFARIGMVKNSALTYMTLCMTSRALHSRPSTESLADP